MDDSLIAEMESHAHFVAGMPPMWRRDDDPTVTRSIENAVKFLNKIESQIEKPGIASGTTSDPQTILMLYWHVRNLRKLYGVSVGFKQDYSCDVSWTGPGRFRDSMHNISLDALLKLDIPRIFAEIDRRSARYKVKTPP